MFARRVVNELAENKKELDNGIVLFSIAPRARLQSHFGEQT